MRLRPSKSAEETGFLHMPTYLAPLMDANTMAALSNQIVPTQTITAHSMVALCKNCKTTASPPTHHLRARTDN